MVFRTFITIARPLRDGDTGVIEEGYYMVDGGAVTLTDQDGKPLVSGRMQAGYSAKLNDEPHERVARRLIWRKYQATRGNSDFNRPLQYRPLGVA